MGSLVENGVVRFEKDDEDDLRRQIDDGIIHQLRAELGWPDTSPEWVRLRFSLRHLSMALGENFLIFPKMVEYLKNMSAMGMTEGMTVMAELLVRIPLNAKDLEIFMGKLFKTCMKDPQKKCLDVLAAVYNVSPANWAEASWYLDLVAETDETMAELTGPYLLVIEKCSTIGKFFLFKLAKTQRLETLDKYVEMLPILERRGQNVAEFIKPVLDFVKIGNYFQADQVMALLLEELNGGLKIRDATLN